MRTGIVNVLFAAGVGVNYIMTGLSNVVVPFRKRNYARNQEQSFCGFVHDQTSGSAAELKMGYKHTSFNGCGCFAAYNAALIKGRSVKPADIVSYYERRGGIVMDGLLGVNPLAVRGFIRSIGLKAEIHNLPKDMDSLVAASKTAIIAYVHKKGMHYVAVEWAEGMFRVYNEHTGGTGYSLYPSLNEWLKSTANYLFAVSLIQVF